MDLLRNLGVNSTVWIHLIIFVVAFAFIYLLMFKPYFVAYLKRLEMTEGNELRADSLNNETTELVLKYASLAKDLNSQTKSYYEMAQKEAQEIHAKTIEATALEVEQMLQSSRKKIVDEVESARRELKSNVSELSHAIELKLLGRDA